MGVFLLQCWCWRQTGAALCLLVFARAHVHMQALLEPALRNLFSLPTATATSAAAGMKEGGQALLGGLDCMVQRNFFGTQINSFETQLAAPACLPRGTDPADTFRAVFIRAPAITETGPGAGAVKGA
jgi:glutamine amidotransferase PdxT